MNRRKTELLIDGGSNTRCKELAERVGISQWSVPVRYLGVPLSSHKMKKSDFHLLVDKVTSRFWSWTVKHLSYAGHLVLVKAVIYSIITLLATIFILPSDCIEALVRMCNGFLWKWDYSSARGAMGSYGMGLLIDKRGKRFVGFSLHPQEVWRSWSEENCWVEPRLCCQADMADFSRIFFICGQLVFELTWLGLRIFGLYKFIGQATGSGKLYVNCVKLPDSLWCVKLTHVLQQALARLMDSAGSFDRNYGSRGSTSHWASHWCDGCRQYQWW